MALVTFASGGTLAGVSITDSNEFILQALTLSGNLVVASDGSITRKRAAIGAARRFGLDTPVDAAAATAAAVVVCLGLAPIDVRPAASLLRRWLRLVSGGVAAHAVALRPRQRGQHPLRALVLVHEAHQPHVELPRLAQRLLLQLRPHLLVHAGQRAAQQP